MPHTILLVDDEEVVIEIAAKKLEAQGFKVLTAFDGEDALKLFPDNKPDIMVLDVQMPKMNGYTFLHELEKRKWATGIPVIMLTAYNTMEPIFKRHGVAAYMLKPLKLEDLVAKIKEVLKIPA